MAVLSESALRARLSVVGGDGQVVAGGPEHRHKSSKAAELIWCRLHPGASADDASDIICCVMWDSFHRVDIGGMRAVRQVRMAQEVYDIAAALDSQFGVGEGRNLLMGVAAQLDETPRMVKGLGGTRKVVYYSSIPMNISSATNPMLQLCVGV